MAPSRRRGANKAKVHENLSLGDLVLAKVKGYPAWPAKISRSEDWGHNPDPKKYFVQFYGTDEIAFVAGVDIEIFNTESKIKLSARLHGKTKSYVKAVNEICAAFDELEKQKASGLRDGTNDSRIGSEATSVDGVIGNLDDATDAVGLNVEKDNTIPGDAGSDLDGCTQRCQESRNETEKLSLSCHPIDSPSPVSSPVLKSESSIGAEINKHARKSGLTDPSYLKVEVSSSKEACIDSNLEHPGNVQCVSTDGDEQRKLGTGSRRSETADDRKGNVTSKSNGIFLKEKSSAGSDDFSNSRERLKGEKKWKNAVSVRSDYPDALKSVSDVKSGNKDKKVKTSHNVKIKFKEKSLAQNMTQVPGKCSFGTNETLHATKKFESMNMKDNRNMTSPPEGVKSFSHGSPVDDKALKKVELKASTSCLNAVKKLASRGQTGVVGSDDSVCKVLAATKHVQIQEAMPDSASRAQNENTATSSLKLKIDANAYAIKQVGKKRKAVCLSDNNRDEPKTPVHGGAAKNIQPPLSLKRGDAYPENADVEMLGNKISSALKGNNFTELSSKLHNDTLSTRHSRKEKANKVVSAHWNHSPEKLDSKMFPSNEEKLISISPVISPLSVSMTKSNAELHKSSKALLKVSSNGTRKKNDQGSSKSLNSISAHGKKPASSKESSKTAPKTLSQVVEVAAATETFKELDAVHVNRLEVGMEHKGSLYCGSRTPETAKTMKHLIAAAQAKRRKVAQSHCHPLGLRNDQERTPSPYTVKFLSVSSNFVQADLQGVNEQMTPASPSTNEHHYASQNQHDVEENEERRVGSVQRIVGGSLSGGTEASIAREAFEGMIETLSRTKDSIGRATRLAIDCAKYGIANEVVELLIQKLEIETSFHRKVDLFFLIDSITQCSHYQKGIAGASYIPTVQGALPRLLVAAAPPGASAHENRRQCLKVLRLWLERKIFPESVLRRHMDDIGVSNTDMTFGHHRRRQFRVERSVDDPIRDMEGMLVDEYGSNATYQLPGILSPLGFEDNEDEDEDIPSNVSPANTSHILAESDTSTVTPNDKQHCILEGVDDELEMENVSAHPKDERPMSLNSCSEMNLQLQPLDRILDLDSGTSAEIPDIHEGSPPTPLDSPPSTPPLPSSPPPLPSPLSTPLPHPPVLTLQPPPPPLPPLGPPPQFVPQSSGPIHPSQLSQALVPPPSSQQTSFELEYQQGVSSDHNDIATGNQIVPMVGSSFNGGQTNVIIKKEIPQAPSARFPPMASCNSHEPSGFNPPKQLMLGQNSIYLNSQVLQPNQQFHPDNPSFTPRHMHPAVPAPPRKPPNQYSYPNSTVQHNHSHPFHPHLSLPSRPDVANELWRMPSSEFKTNNDHVLWRGRNPSCPPRPFGKEGYFQPPLERPPVNKHVNPNIHPLPPPPPPPPRMAGHVPQMISCRPDIPALNCWRPT